MSVQIKGGKLLRLNYIIANQSDRLRLIAKLKQSYAEADAIKVNDLGGLTFEYTPSIGEETRNPLRIPKKLVEEYNAQLVEDANENEEDVPDFDSLEVLKGQLDYWVEQAVGGESIVFTENDIVAIEAVAGKVGVSRFVYSYAQNGLLDNTIIGRQKRFTSTRVPLTTKIGNTPLVVNTLNGHDIIAKIVTAAQNTVVDEDATYLDYDDARLFPEDIELPVTHFVDGKIYTVTLSSNSLDYTGSFDISIDLSAEDPEEETPPGGVVTGAVIATLTPVDENGEIKTEWLDTDENITYRLDLQFDGGVVQVNNVLVNTQDVTLYDGIASLNLQIDKSQIEEATHNGVAGLYPVQNSVDIQSPNEMVTGIQLVYANPIMIQPTAQLYLTPWDEVNQEPLTTVMTGSQINVRVGVEFGSVPFDIDLFYQSTSGSNNQAQFFEGMSFTAYVSGNPGANQAFYFETSSASGVIREVNIASVEIVEVPPEEV